MIQCFCDTNRRRHKGYGQRRGRRSKGYAVHCSVSARALLFRLRLWLCASALRRYVGAYVETSVDCEGEVIESDVSLQRTRMDE